jgi:hypothetical protein
MIVVPEGRAECQVIHTSLPFEFSEGSTTQAAIKGFFTRSQILRREACLISPNHPSAHNNLAKLLDEALVHYRKVIEIEPDIGEAHFNLANTLRKNRKVK